jgi:hypothetical protein
MFKSKPVGPLIKEAGLRSTDSLLSNRHRRYPTRAFGHPIRHQIRDGIRRTVSDKCIFGKLSNVGMNGVELRLLGQQLVERTWIPTYNQMLSVPVIIESREQAEQTAIELEGHPGRCIWTDAS